MEAQSIPVNSIQMTKSSHSNLALSFILLPPEKRLAMSTLYAFCHHTDDIADCDEPVEKKRQQLQFWRDEIDFIFQGKARHPLGIELQPVVEKYRIPREYFFDFLSGLEMDLASPCFQTAEDLFPYNYRVASVVGLMSIEVFGYSNPKCRDYAVELGQALQWTNIIRDIQNDLQRGRIYLPRTDLEKFGYGEDQLRKEIHNRAFVELMQHQTNRARFHYTRAEHLLPPEDARNMVAAEMMRSVYSELLKKIEASNFDVFGEMPRLSKPRKLLLALKTAARVNRKTSRPLRSHKKVLILGGGFAGLAAAVELAGKGFEVELLEAKGFLGGRAHSFSDAKTGEIVDNGQHLFMGCYKETIRFLGKIGCLHLLRFQDALEVEFVRRGGKKSTLSTLPLPAPLHLLGGILTFNGLSWRERINGLKVGSSLSWNYSRKRRELDKITVSEWLKRLDQTSNAQHQLWNPIAIATLNENTDVAPAGLFAEVIKRAFLSFNPSDSSIGIARVGLSELYTTGAKQYIEARLGRVRMGCPVQKVIIKNGRAIGLLLENGDEIFADVVISALPYSALKSILPLEEFRKDGLEEKLGKFQPSPIISINLWFDTSFTDREFIGFTDSPIHWFFNRTKIHDMNSSRHFAITLVVSGAHEWIEKSTQELVDVSVSELNRLIPESGKSKLIHSFVFKARDATFSARTDLEQFRPSSKTCVPNFFLAGDWTDTQLPATIEGAVKSGHTSAQLVADEFQR